MTAAPPTHAISGAPALDLLFPSTGEMAERVRAFDWAATPLGPLESWPQSLLVAVGICLNSRFPTFVWWGPELINIHNDAYAPDIPGTGFAGAQGESRWSPRPPPARRCRWA